MATLWVTGANGVLGWSVVRQAAESGAYERICALTHAPIGYAADAFGQGGAAAPIDWRTLDLRDHDGIARLGRDARPSVIINCGAMTNVDGCEDAPDLAWAINADGPRALAQVARDTGAALLHVSTDYVFPGDDANPGPYSEDAPVRPVSVYGASKLGGERAITQELGDSYPWLIARTAIVIGAGPNQRPNFVTWLARELHAGRRVRIVSDQFNTPTLADDLAQALLWQARAGVTGVYHTAGPTLLGRHEWALAIADHFHLSRDLIDWVTSAELKQKAQRPLRGGLSCQRLLADQARGAPRFLGAVECLGAIDWGLEF